MLVLNLFAFSLVSLCVGPSFSFEPTDCPVLCLELAVRECGGAKRAVLHTALRNRANRFLPPALKRLAHTTATSSSAPYLDDE